MTALAPTTDAGRAGLAALLDDPAAALIGFDFDGTLSPIVDDPEAAFVLPGMGAALSALAGKVGTVAVVTGRPAATAVRLGGFDSVPGLDGLVVLGQYGVERWDGRTGDFSTVEPPPGLALVRSEIGGVLAAAGVHDADIEDKGLAVAVHVRRSADPVGAFEAVQAPLRELAQRAGLAVEPGRFVVELRRAGMDKGVALAGLAAERAASILVFAGDDLGDLAAFDAVDSARADGGAGLLV